MSDDGAPLGGDVPANSTPRASRDALFLGAVIERQAGLSHPLISRERNGEQIGVGDMKRAGCYA